VYRVLLPLAFGVPITYSGYCEIEDAVRHPPRGMLRRVLLSEFRFASYIPWLLAVKAEPEEDDERLMAWLASTNFPPEAPLRELARDVRTLRPEHRAGVYDFAVSYLRAHAEDPRSELAKRGYLADLLEDLFPGNVREQRGRLHDILRFVYGRRLSKNRVRELFADPAVRPTDALVAAVSRLASGGLASARFVAEQADLARRARG
jgi:hypothetical protein